MECNMVLSGSILVRDCKNNRFSSISFDCLLTSNQSPSPSFLVSVSFRPSSFCKSPRPSEWKTSPTIFLFILTQSVCLLSLLASLFFPSWSPSFFESSRDTFPFINSLTHRNRRCSPPFMLLPTIGHVPYDRVFPPSSED